MSKFLELNEWSRGPALLPKRAFPDNRGMVEVIADDNSQLDFYDYDGEFVQAFVSSSNQGVARGLHWQGPNACQGKLIRCLKGEILDFYLDLRIHSDTYLHKGHQLLSPDSGSFWLPPGFAHGFSSKTESEVLYLTTVGRVQSEEQATLLTSVFPELVGKEENILSFRDSNALPIDLIPDRYHCAHKGHLGLA